jgi:hypothetical protein
MMPDDQFLAEADHFPNLNSVTLAGVVTAVDRPAGQTPTLTFTISHRKHWPRGTQAVPLTCLTTGHRVAPLSWLQPGETVLVHGELTGEGTVYARTVERLSRPGRRALGETRLDQR